MDAPDSLEALLWKYLPHDSDDVITSMFVHQWKSLLPKATRVVLQWTESHGVQQLEARWLDEGGSLVTRFAASPTAKRPVEEFAREWVNLMQSLGREAVFEDRRGT